MNSFKVFNPINLKATSNMTKLATFTDETLNKVDTNPLKNTLRSSLASRFLAALIVEFLNKKLCYISVCITDLITSNG